jgi:hypothetical protein
VIFLAVLLVSISVHSRFKRDPSSRTGENQKNHEWTRFTILGSATSG